MHTALAITTVDLARIQFATTSIYHFFFVPLTLGLGPLVAVMQTMWYRTRDERWLRLTHFFGTLFLINFAIGVATGLVQEFQFGMNWSVYSKFVGNIFGAPLAIEGLAAFMLEAIKLVLGLGDPLIGRLLAYDALETSFRNFKVRRDPECPACGPNAAPIVIAEYDEHCLPHAVLADGSVLTH